MEISADLTAITGGKMVCLEICGLREAKKTDPKLPFPMSRPRSHWIPLLKEEEKVISGVSSASASSIEFLFLLNWEEGIEKGI